MNSWSHWGLYVSEAIWNFSSSLFIFILNYSMFIKENLENTEKSKEKKNSHWLRKIPDYFVVFPSIPFNAKLSFQCL